MGKLIGMLGLDDNSGSWPSWDEANRAFQKEYLIQVLKTANGNQCLAAHLLQIHRNTLARHCESLGIQPDSYGSKRNSSARRSSSAPPNHRAVLRICSRSPKGPAMPVEIMNIRECAAYLGISQDTLYKYAAAGLLPAFKLGNRWRFKLESIDNWMRNQSSGEEVSNGRGK